MNSVLSLPDPLSSCWSQNKLGWVIDAKKKLRFIINLSSNSGNFPFCHTHVVKDIKFTTISHNIRAQYRGSTALYAFAKSTQQLQCYDIMIMKANKVIRPFTTMRIHLIISYHTYNCDL